MRNKLAENGSFCGFDLCVLVEIVFISIDPHTHQINERSEKKQTQKKQLACKCTQTHPQTL